MNPNRSTDRPAVYRFGTLSQVGAGLAVEWLDSLEVGLSIKDFVQPSIVPPLPYL